jgi:23S rRNA (uracil1939-C5)-methyltransferase
VRCGGGGDGALVFRGGAGDGRPEELLAAVSSLSSVWKAGENGGVRHLAGEDTLELSWLGERFRLSGGSFVQVNQGAGEALHRHVLERVGDVEGTRVVEGYSGIGILGRELARRGGRVVGVEIDGNAVCDARRGAPEGFEAVQGGMERILPGLLPADLVILNPPRAGLDPEIPRVLTTTPPPRLVYVSCDPATLARDLNRLGRGYEVTDLRCFDLFPQTGHVETVVFLKRLDE